MTERYGVKGTDEFFQHIEDTTLTEDKDEGAIYDIHQVTRRLNEQDKEIQKLQKENQQLKKALQTIIENDFKLTNDENKDYDALTEFFKNEVNIKQIEVEIDVEKED